MRDRAGSASNGRGPKKAEALARLLLERGLEEGSPLPPEMALCAEYRVGRNTVREAQRILEVHGALDINTGFGGGAQVTVPDSRDHARIAAFYFRAAGVRMHQLTEARLVMEPLSAGLAARRRTPEDEEALRRTLEVLARRRAGPDNPEFLSAGREFHQLISTISGNPVISLFSMALVHMVVDRAGLVYPEHLREDVVEAHLGIGRAILNGNAARAERLMREHILESDARVWETLGRNEALSWR
ncbi:MAG TPA: FCD domain-containing protein [Candidatus Dormibacteraeota bacterium]|nr:FCD domain-containing protein [Candidatus Dormibacteraeota bacterium]